MTFSQSTKVVSRRDEIGPQNFDIHRSRNQSQWNLLLWRASVTKIAKGVSYVRSLASSSFSKIDNSPTYRTHYFSDINMSPGSVASDGDVW